MKDSGFEGVPKERAGRSFRFNPKGKYVQLGNQMRQENQLEALKQRIAESARKAGLDSEFETLEKNIKVRIFTAEPTEVDFVCSVNHPPTWSGGMLPCYRARLTTTLHTVSETSIFALRTRRSRSISNIPSRFPLLATRTRLASSHLN